MLSYYFQYLPSCINFTKYSIVVEFSKNWNTNYVFCHYIVTKNKINVGGEVINDMSQWFVHILLLLWGLNITICGISRSVELFSHHFEHLALKYPVTIKYTQKFSDLSLIWLCEPLRQVKKHFSLPEQISITKQLPRAQDHLS